MQRRSRGPILDPDIVFPPLEVFDHPKKLPTTKSVIGVIRYLTEDKLSHSSAIKEVSKLVYAKWYHDTVYCISLRSINRKLSGLWDIFREGRKREREKGRKPTEKYKSLVLNAGQLFDIHVDDNEACFREWGVKMTKREKECYEDMKDQRLMECDHGVDPVWYTAMLREQRKKELCAKYRERQREQFRTVDIDKIRDTLMEEALLSQDEVDDESDETKETKDLLGEPEQCSSGQIKRKKRRFDTSNSKESEVRTGIPDRYCHIRDSERNVSDDVYKTIANLVGVGLSIQEAISALVIVGNTKFHLAWKNHDESKDIIDMDTMPHYRNVLEKLKLIEAQSLSLVVEEVQKQSSEGRMITHAIDSTTKKRAGTFATQGLHIGQDIPFPLPLCGIVGESTDDVAMQIDFAFEILAAIRGITVEELYQTVDCHMTDSTKHNKGIADVLKDLYNLDKKAGQIFCGTHTTLGFSREMNRITSMIEKDMKLEQILAHFMVDIAPDTKHDSIAGQALDMALKFVAPEFDSKMWNYHKDFVDYLSKNEVDDILFDYKDKRLGYLSRAAAVLLFYWDSIC